MDLNFGPWGVLADSSKVPWNCTTAEYIASNCVTFQYKSKVQLYSYFSYSIYLGKFFQT
jgi:hypothetical protein